MRYAEAPGLDAEINRCLEPETLGLTFDDGPNCTEPAFYNFLKDNNQKADLFYIGSNVRNWPNEAKLGYEVCLMPPVPDKLEEYSDTCVSEAGHHIAVHTWSHPLLTSLSNDDVLAELYYTKKIIKLVTGVTPKYFRPPQGDIDDRVRAIGKALGLTNIQWNIDSFDWTMQPMGPNPPSQIDANFQSWITKVQNGSFASAGAISLEHEANEWTQGKAMEWYPKIKAAFKHVMPVVSCANIKHPYVETDLAFPSFQEVVGGRENGAAPTGVTAGNNKNGASQSSTGAFGLAALVVGAVLLL